MEQVQLIFRNFKHISNLYKKILAKELSTFKLDQQFETLLVLAMQEKPVKQNRLAELLQTDKSRVANIVFDLETQGFIGVERNPADRREHYISLTPKAHNHILQTREAIEKTNHLAELGISEDKLNTFFEVSEQIEQNLKAKMAS